MSEERTITVAQTAGFCFGVDRAVSRLYELVDEYDSVCTLGPIIHNRHVTDEFAHKGVRVLDDPHEAQPSDCVVIRSHGVPKEAYDVLAQRGAKVVDLTCPFVKRIHTIVEQESAKGRAVVIVGDKDHPEVIGIRGYCTGDCLIVSDVEELREKLTPDSPWRTKPVSAVVQTTFDARKWEICVSFLKNICTNPVIFDTICVATSKRQEEAALLSQRSDLMVVVGSPHSANTLSLKAVCEAYCPTVLVESKDDVDLGAWPMARRIGVTAGASTPGVIIKEVTNRMTDITKDEVMETENFEEMLEQSLKSIYTGEKVVGTVIGFTPTEVQVDIGTKHAGYIPFHELSEDPSVNPQEFVKVGDEIELIAIRVNDMEGTVMLSKRRVDAIAGYEKVMNAEEEGTILDGVVSDVIKGGLIVVTNGVKVFVPASQASISRGIDLQTLVKQPVKLKIIEVNRQRSRAVGSIRAAAQELRKEEAEKFWETAEIGAEYEGVVSSLTSYGAFVNLGGVDGLVHISELSWLRLKHPSEVVNVGDKVNVFIKDLDFERKRITLGYKDKGESPWDVFTQTYKVGDVVHVKVNSLTSFGAFVNLVPGVDGLIHVSQISHDRIELPSSVLKVGDMVDAKITDINSESKRVSLSIKALLSPSDFASEMSAEAEPDEEPAPQEDPAPETPIAAEEPAAPEAPAEEEPAKEAVDDTTAE